MNILMDAIFFQTNIFLFIQISPAIPIVAPDKISVALRPLSIYLRGHCL